MVSPPRGVGPEEKRWAGIETALPLGELHTAADLANPGEEGLCLARLTLDGASGSSVLVACSVLPWKGSAQYSPGLPPGQAAEVRHVLDHHVPRIAADQPSPAEAETHRICGGSAATANAMGAVKLRCNFADIAKARN